MNWDVSASYGRNRIDYKLANSINASMGPASPTAFYLGRLSQEEKF
jgi:iron complex outermembrane receptor protein